jgi:hypothetical protein
MTTVDFREEQRFTPVITVLGVIAVVVGLAMLLVPGLLRAGLMLAATGGLTILIFAVLKIVTEVRDDGLYVRLFPLPFRHIAWDKIQSHRVRTYHPLLEYGGWGIRFGISGKAYSARGNRGVQLVLRSGRRVLIGSQMPESLDAAMANFVPQVPQPVEA